MTSGWVCFFPYRFSSLNIWANLKYKRHHKVHLQRLYGTTVCLTTLARLPSSFTGISQSRIRLNRVNGWKLKGSVMNCFFAYGLDVFTDPLIAIDFRLLLLSQGSQVPFHFTVRVDSYPPHRRQFFYTLHFSPNSLIPLILQFASVRPPVKPAQKTTAFYESCPPLLFLSR